jgi:hypothetical protein
MKTEWCLFSLFDSIAVVEVPEGSGPFAHVLAEAGITRDMFQSVGEA